MTTIEITVTNKTGDEVWRGGYVFQPRATRTVNVDKTGMAEIKACQALRIESADKKEKTEPKREYPCDFPDCKFVAKNPGALSFHKKKHAK